MPDYDPRLVQLYDTDNPDGPDHDFFRALADQVGARTVIDLGCGTGILAVTLARPGRTHLIGPAWSATLHDIHAGLRPGGHLAFERRNPVARAWERGVVVDAVPAGARDVCSYLRMDVARRLRARTPSNVNEPRCSQASPMTSLGVERSASARQFLQTRSR